MEHPEEKEVDPETYFVYTSDTKEADIPTETLTHLRVDSSLGEIPDNAFQNCRGLTHVQLPETLRRIGISAFGRCLGLKSVHFVSRNASLQIPSINENVEDGTIVFPETMVEIDVHAFVGCYRLRKIIVCSGFTKLGEGAFSECRGLVSVDLPERLQVINVRLFADCSSLTTISIPSSVIKIDEGAFVGCGSLSFVELSPGLKVIGRESFSYCVSIETLHIPSTVSSIRDGAFNECVGLKHIKLPPTLKSMEPRIFTGCRSLEYLEFPTTVTDIGYEAFKGCLSLSHVRIPKSFKRFTPVPREALSTYYIFESPRCSSLISIELPEGIPFELDPYDCLSLVNVAGPILWLDRGIESTAYFLQHSKLGRVVNNIADLTLKLKHRFDNSPLIKLCYYQAYHSLEDAMIQLRGLMEDDPLAAATQVDEFGMTPLHVLSLSQTPNLDILQAVMDAGRPGDMIRSRDSFGCTPMDYLCLNRMPNSTEVIKELFQTRYDQVLGMDRSWKSSMMQEVDQALVSMVADRSSRRREIVRVVRKYERKATLSLLELYLWKVKIDEVLSKKEQVLVDRQRCRIMSGAGIVIPLVRPFLDKLDVEDFFVSFSFAW
eukprot:scaffold10313_cov138-Cylindrotheca_fusiformis.AAC.3